MARPAFKNWITHVQTRRTEQLLKYAAESKVISFAGGLPAEELFPSAELERAFQLVITEQAAEALQYTWSEGCERLREQVAAQMSERGLRVSPDEIIITSGAQQGLDLLAKLFIRSGDALAIETPTYVPAIQSFEMHAPKFLPLPRESSHLDINAFRRQALQSTPRLLYLIPAGHNPTGGVLAAEQHHEILAAISGMATIVIEDAAYADIQYEAPRPPMFAIDRARVLFLGSFSKVLSPGLRVGWIAGPADVIRQLALIKQATDLQTSTLNQLVLSRYFESHTLKEQIARCIPFYRERRGVMLEALKGEFPSDARWNTPAAGFSVWIELPSRVNTEELLTQAVAHGVAFEPGRPFFVTHKFQNFLRLSFSNQPPEQIREGVRRLGTILRSALRAG